VSETGTRRASPIAAKAASASASMHTITQAAIMAARPIPARQWMTTRLPSAIHCVTERAKVIASFMDEGTTRSAMGNDTKRKPC
jgi:hypothetical protein